MLVNIWGSLDRQWLRLQLLQLGLAAHREAKGRVQPEEGVWLVGRAGEEICRGGGWW